jgi:hypothetical protein
MKRLLIAFLVLGFLCSPAIAQPKGDLFQNSKADLDLYQQLAEGPDRIKAMETVLEAPQERTALILFFGAGVAHKEKRLEDAGFLFYAAKLRASFDKECFPAAGEGPDSPFVLFSALNQQLGSEVAPAVSADPKVFAKVIERLKAWSPKAPPEYDPGYEYTERKAEEDAEKAVKAKREEFLSRMSDLSTLLNDAEYFTAYRVVQAFNLERGEKRPTKEEKEKAEETMKRIEGEKNLKGIPTKAPPNN